MNDTIKMILGVIAFILIADVYGFLLWELSGQVPVDAFHTGLITEKILNIIK
jgi:hypothetical protein